MKLDLTLDANRVEYLVKSVSESDKDSDLKNIFCSSSITNPIPNSTADKTKNKKVSDSKLMLS